MLDCPVVSHQPTQFLAPNESCGSDVERMRQQLVWTRSQHYQPEVWTIRVVDWADQGHCESYARVFAICSMLGCDSVWQPSCCAPFGLQPTLLETNFDHLNKKHKRCVWKWIAYKTKFADSPCRLVTLVIVPVQCHSATRPLVQQKLRLLKSLTQFRFDPSHVVLIQPLGWTTNMHID